MLEVATPTLIIYGNNTIVSAAMVTFTPHEGKSSGAIHLNELNVSLLSSVRHGARCFHNITLFIPVWTGRKSYLAFRN